MFIDAVLRVSHSGSFGVLEVWWLGFDMAWSQRNGYQKNISTLSHGRGKLLRNSNAEVYIRSLVIEDEDNKQQWVRVEMYEDSNAHVRDYMCKFQEDLGPYWWASGPFLRLHTLSLTSKHTW